MNILIYLLRTAPYFLRKWWSNIDWHTPHCPPSPCHHCSQMLTIHHLLLKCAVLQENHDGYCTTDPLNTLWISTRSMILLYEPLYILYNSSLESSPNRWIFFITSPLPTTPPPPPRHTYVRSRTHTHMHTHTTTTTTTTTTRPGQYNQTWTI